MIISIAQQKGGTGKTTTALNIAAGLAALNKNVLCIDLDAQANLSFMLGAEEGPTSYDVLMGTASADAAAQMSHGFDLIPASPELANIDAKLAEKTLTLASALSPMATRYDYVIIDTPPALGRLTINAFGASDGVIAPCLADLFSLQAATNLKATLNAIKPVNPRLELMGLLLTRFDGRQVLARQVARLLEGAAREMGSKVFKSRIRESVAIREAQARRQSVFTYAPSSPVAMDYVLLIKELLQG